jgi:MORN repeat
MLRASWRATQYTVAGLLLCACQSCSAISEQSNQPGLFVADPLSKCKIWDPHPVAGETVKWSGGCTDGLAQGAGTLQWFRAGKLSEIDRGEWKEGRQSGHGTQDWFTGRYEGELLNGEPHGRGAMTLQNSRYDGEFSNGKPDGEGTFANLEGVFSGRWKEGCRVDGGRKIAFAVSPATCR